MEAERYLHAYFDTRKQVGGWRGAIGWFVLEVGWFALLGTIVYGWTSGPLWSGAEWPGKTAWAIIAAASLLPLLLSVFLQATARAQAVAALRRFQVASLTAAQMADRLTLLRTSNGQLGRSYSFAIASIVIAVLLWVAITQIDWLMLLVGAAIAYCIASFTICRVIWQHDGREAEIKALLAMDAATTRTE